jgi:hypothetical protein
MDEFLFFIISMGKSSLKVEILSSDSYAIKGKSFSKSFFYFILGIIVGCFNLGGKFPEV